MRSGNEIAIVGMSGRFPGASNLDELWEILRDGRETLRNTEQDTSSPAMSDQTSHMVRANCVLEDLDLFDAAFFGFNPREAEMTDPQHRVFLECAWEALETAGIKAGDRARPIGVFAGTGSTSYVFGQIEHDAQILDAFPAIIATDRDFVSTRVSFKLNLTGPSLTVQCACSTAMVAVHLACQSLLAGECDAAIAGGVSAAVPQHDTYKYMPGAMLAPDGRCRSFDADGRGTVFTDGAAAITLMRLDDALAGGYPVRAVILGSAVNNDGSQKPGYTAPTVDGQVKVVSQALAMAGIEAGDVDFIEAHGTGTVLGDAIEIGALTKVMRASTTEVGRCALGSIKANIGHTLAAAGVAGIIKAVLALEHQAIPGCPNFETPNPDLDLATSPFVVNTELLPWDKPTNGIRRVGVSSFGVGGTNAHVVMEEAPPAESAPSGRTWHVLPLSTRSEAVLPTLVDRMRAHLVDRPAAFADTVYTAQVGRRSFEHRRVVIAADATGAATALAGEDPTRVFSRKAPTSPPKVAFMFTGQGSQYPGMGADLYRDEPPFRAAVDRALALLDADRRAELLRLVFGALAGPPADEDHAALQRTETAQLALFVMHVALTELLGAWGVRPAMMIGHSIGDYAAAHVAGVLSLEEAIALVTARGRLMGEMAPGTMLSVAADLADLPPLPPNVSVAAVNAPRLIVLAGPTDAIADYERNLTAGGFGTRRLHTSHAFHSAMMEPMLARFRTTLATVALGAPAIPFVSSLTGEFASVEETGDGAFWARQIREPVQFARGCEAIAAAGATVVLEVGPGRGLSALARQCGLVARGIDVVTTMPESSEPGMHLTVALGRLWLAGVDVQWTAFHTGDARRRIAIPTTPFNRQRFWIDPAQRFAPRETVEKLADVGQWFYAPAWKQLAPVATIGTRPGEPAHVLVVGDPAGLAGVYADRLRQAGDAVTTLPETSPDALDALLTRWSDAADVPDRIVHLSSLEGDRTNGDVDPATFWRSQDRDVLGLLRLLQTVSTVGGGKSLAVHIVSTGIYDVTGTDPLRPENAPLVTFARVAPQEVAGVTCRLIDIEPIAPGDDLADLSGRIDARFAAGGATDTVVAIRRRRAWRLDYERLDTSAVCAARPATRDRGVYLITGGLGNVGLVFARYLARSCAARLVLVGRSAVPAPALWDGLLSDPDTDAGLVERLRAIRELEALGAEVLAVAADVSDDTDMQRAIALAQERFGRIDGFVHCAGVTNVGRIILDTTRSEFEQNFRSKVFGLTALERLLGDHDLDFGMVVSSLSAVLGGLGHMAYAAANACADAMILAHNQTGRGSTWMAVDWDSWKFESGRIDAVQAMLNTLDFSLDEREGCEAIDRLLSMQESEYVIVSTGSLAARVRQWIEERAEPQSAGAKNGERHERPDVETPFEEPQGAIEERLAAIWQDALGLDRVGRNDDFFEIGGHSLLAVQILSKTREAFGVDFPLDRAVEVARLSSAAAVIAELLEARAAAPAADATSAQPAPVKLVASADEEPAAELSAA
jgi:acyl transferase domain-containing protein